MKNQRNDRTVVCGLTLQFLVYLFIGYIYEEFLQTVFSFAVYDLRWYECFFLLTNARLPHI
jgi:hypothetical protein